MSAIGETRAKLIMLILLGGGGNGKNTSHRGIYYNIPWLVVNYGNISVL